MHRYRCPKCKSKLDLDKIYDGGYLAKCHKCKFTHITRTKVERDDEAYLNILEDYDNGKILKGTSFSKALEKEGILRSKKDVQYLVEKTGTNLTDIPKPMQHALLSTKDYPVLYRRLSSEEPTLGMPSMNLSIDTKLSEAILRSGIKRLYKFQVDSFKAITEEQNVAIIAPTGTGKTEAFAIPIIHNLSQSKKRIDISSKKNVGIKALIIYPTKALARDQLPKLEHLADPVGITIKIYDGDTSKYEKNNIIEEPPDIIITNFDSLHYHLLHHTHFSRLLSNIEYMIVDEIHVYTGTFGSNIHLIIKRLERLCRSFQVIAASATISNPKKFCDELFSRRFIVINGGDGKHGVMHLAMMFPSLRSHRALTLDLLQKLTTSGNKTIVFSNSHLAAELNAFYGRRNGIEIEVHRAGLLSDFRKEVEERFRNGDLKAISCTPTLELGIDIGTLDAVISDLVTWTRFIQRIGRAGRKGQESIVFLALRKDDPISQYYKNNPEDYFKDIEPGYIEPFNPVISKFQLLAASIDKPIQIGEFTEFQSILDELVEEGTLIKDKEKLIPAYPTALRILRGYDIRGSGDNVSIMYLNKKIGSRSMPQALDELHMDAVYFLGGSRYKSKGLKYLIGSGRAEVERLPKSYPYYTRPLKEEYPTIQKILLRKKILQTEVAYCDLFIERKIIGYTNIGIGAEISKGKKILLEKPHKYTFRTKGLIFKAPLPTKIFLSSTNTEPDLLEASSFHAAEHVTIEGTNMITGGAASDMGGISIGNSGMIFIYDGARGGNGVTRILFDKLNDVFQRGLSILDECTCNSEDGCPRCTYSYRCGNNNEYLHREGAKEVFKKILDGELSELDLNIKPELRPLV